MNRKTTFAGIAAGAVALLSIYGVATAYGSSNLEPAVATAPLAELGRFDVARLQVREHEDMFKVDRATGTAWAFWVNPQGAERQWEPIEGGPPPSILAEDWRITAAIYPGIERHLNPVLYNARTGKAFVLQGLDPLNYVWIEIAH